MRFGEAIISGYRKFAVVSGRDSPAQYWAFVRFGQAAQVAIVGCVVAYAFLSTQKWMGQMSSLSEGGASTVAPLSRFSGVIGALVMATLVVSIPQTTSAVRRLHDTGRSGWHYAVPPLVGLSVLVLLYVAFAPEGVTPIMALFVLFTPIWFYEPKMIVGLVAFAALLIVLRTRLTRKLREPSQPGPNHYGPPPSEVTP